MLGLATDSWLHAIGKGNKFALHVCFEVFHSVADFFHGNVFIQTVVKVEFFPEFFPDIRQFLLDFFIVDFNVIEVLEPAEKLWVFFEINLKTEIMEKLLLKGDKLVLVDVEDVEKLFDVLFFGSDDFAR